MDHIQSFRSCRDVWILRLEVCVASAFTESEPRLSPPRLPSPAAWQRTGACRRSSSGLCGTARPAAATVTACTSAGTVRLLRLRRLRRRRLLPPTHHYRLSTTHYPPPTIYYLLATTCYIPATYLPHTCYLSCSCSCSCCCCSCYYYDGDDDYLTLLPSPRPIMTNAHRHE